MIAEVVITSVQLNVETIKPAIGEKVPTVVYTRDGTASGIAYTVDGKAITFSAPISPKVAGDLYQYFQAAAGEVLGLMKGGDKDA